MVRDNYDEVGATKPEHQNKKHNKIYYYVFCKEACKKVRFHYSIK